MNMVLCMREELDGNIASLNNEHLDEEACQDVVVAVLRFFQSFIDTRPYHGEGWLSMRAENVLRRNAATTIGDVRRLLTQACSNQGVLGAGALVRQEWATLLRTAASSHPC